MSAEMDMDGPEFAELMEVFEAEYELVGRKLAREPRSSWARGYVYRNGEANCLFRAYRAGYELGRGRDRDARP